MTISTLNEDEYAGDAGKSVDEVLLEVEELARTLATGDAGVDHNTRPAGYGKLLETYEWRPYPVPAGCAPEVRAWCYKDAAFMVLTLKVDPRYGREVRNGVEYKGRPVQAWECPSCHQWTIK